jgi:hypothetical protein
MRYQWDFMTFQTFAIHFRSMDQNETILYKLFFLYLSDVGAKWLIQKSTLFYKVIPSAMKKWLYMRGGLSSRGQFMSTGTMYLICQSACQIWPEKMCGFWWEGPYKGRVMTFNITFNNISVSFTGAGNRSTRKKKHQPAAHNWQTWSHNVVLSAPRLSVIQTHNVNGDRHWLHR